jgi:hypothetical protein
LENGIHIVGVGIVLDIHLPVGDTVLDKQLMLEFFQVFDFYGFVYISGAYLK